MINPREKHQQLAALAAWHPWVSAPRSDNYLFIGCLLLPGVTQSSEESSKIPQEGFPGGAVVKNPLANAGDTGSSPGPGRSHMPWSN